MYGSKTYLQQTESAVGMHLESISMIGTCIQTIVSITEVVIVLWDTQHKPIYMGPPLEVDSNLDSRPHLDDCVYMELIP